MRIKNKRLIELFKADDTDSILRFPFVITSEVLDDPSALEELVELFKNDNKIRSVSVIVKKDDPELSQKIAKVLPKSAIWLDILIECPNVENLDFSSEEFDNIKSLELNDSKRSYGNPHSIGNISLPKKLEKLEIDAIDSISHVEVPDEIKDNVSVQIYGFVGKHICDVTIPKVENIVLSMDYFDSKFDGAAEMELATLKHRIDLFPDAKYWMDGTHNKSNSLVGVKEKLDVLISLLKNGSIPCSQEQFEELIIFVNEMCDKNNLLKGYICDGQEVIDIKRFHKFKKQDFNFSFIENEKYATIVIKDATELSTLEAKEMEKIAKEKGLKLFIQMEDKNLNNAQKIPYSLSDYIACSTTLDEIIETVRKSLPEGASEAKKYAKLLEVIAKREEYDFNALEEVDYDGAIVKEVSSRNLMCLVSGKGVCAGFAEAMRNAARRMEFECEYDHGTILREGDESASILDIEGKLPDGTPIISVGHAWNLVKIDGKWYLSDVTFAMEEMKHGQAPLEFLFSDSLAKKMGRKLSIMNRPKCEDDFPREKVAELFPNYFSKSLLSKSTVDLYGLKTHKLLLLDSLNFSICYFPKFKNFSSSRILT